MMHQIAPYRQQAARLARPIEVISRGIAANFSVGRHSHRWGQFVHATRGTLAVNLTGARYIVPPEQGVWIPPNVEHEVIALNDVAVSSFYFDNAQLGELPKQACVLDVNAFLKTLICEASNISNDYDWQASDGRLLRLIRDRLGSAANVIFQLPYPQDARLLVILDKLQRDPSNKHDLKQWGDIVGASARSLSRLFKKQTGLSYSQWRIRLNIQLAITQLASGESVTNTALFLGYESASSFIYMFKKQTGITPGFYLYPS